MAIGFYLSESFTSGELIDLVDVFVGNGVTTTFVCVNKSVQRLASTITVGSVQYAQYNGGFTKNVSNNSFTLASAPANGTVVVAPGINMLTFPVFDQDNVPGELKPRVNEQPFWLGDPTDINNQYYNNLPQFAGIQISINDLISATGAQTSWCQLACADPTTGLAMTYGATGVALYTAAIQSFGVAFASATAGASSIFCSTASTFLVGDYVTINLGTPSQEIRKVALVSNSSGGYIGLTTTFDFPHYIGETIFTTGRKFWCKVTAPLDVGGGQAVNFYDEGPRARGRIVSRV